MSTIDYRPRGGQRGIVVTMNELTQFATFMDASCLDEFIPIPELDMKTQKQRVAECTCMSEDKDSEYWETEDGDHGWCCANCGRVNQWG